jgi:hypothetical protein
VLAEVDGEWFEGEIDLGEAKAAAARANDASEELARREAVVACSSTLLKNDQ